MIDDLHIAEVIRQLKDGTWKLPPTAELSADFLDRIIPGRERHTWLPPGDFDNRS